MTTDEIMAEFRARRREVVAFVEGCPDELWTKELPDGERTVAAVASHIGRAYDLQREIFETLPRGQPPPTKLDRLDEINARDAAADRGAAKEDVIARLNAASFRMELLLGRLTAEELARPIKLPGGEGPPLDEVIRGGALGHPAGHLEELRAATS